jgi:hypothetical protein
MWQSPLDSSGITTENQLEGHVDVFISPDFPISPFL